ncbi:MAG: RlmE family RNA methyltransferase [Alphaproteobacteria bacterium]|nr:RlmE family RNA methyltransferase [Alphaproteobacteria bacterium]
MSNSGNNSGGKSTLGTIASRRRKAVRVKAKSRRSESSRQWLLRHLNDPYVAAAQEEGYRSRAAYKLLQLDEKCQLLKPGMRVIDLGAAPGGWTQVAFKKIGRKNAKLVALDILPMEPMDGVDILCMDFTADDAPDKLRKLIGGSADLVLSDMAPNATGHPGTDHIRIMALAEMAAYFAVDILAPGGTFVCKFFQGGAEKELLAMLKQNFAKTKHVKPAASRAESSETYLVASGFRGTA